MQEIDGLKTNHKVRRAPIIGLHLCKQFKLCNNASINYLIDIQINCNLLLIEGNKGFIRLT